MAQFQARPAKGLDKVDPVWARIRSEAEDIARREPELATFIYENILHHDKLEGWRSPIASASGWITPTFRRT